jgi:hypothetical protein
VSNQHRVSINHLIGPESGRAGDEVTAQLQAGGWTRFTAIVAFARMSGVRHVEALLGRFVAAGGRVDLTIGTDMLGTTYEAVWYLAQAVAPRGSVLLASAEPGATFHPKIYVFSDASATDPSAPRALRRASRALVVVGSSNLTGGGLYDNDEASTIWRPALGAADDAAAWSALVDAVSPWLSSKGPGILGTATTARLTRMARAGELAQELAVKRSVAPRSHVGASRRRRSQLRRRRPKPPALAGAPPPPLSPPTRESTPGLNVLIARLAFGGSRRWPQWELNMDVLSSFFGIAAAGQTIPREGVTRSGTSLGVHPTPLVIGTNRNRRLEFPEPEARPDPSPRPALLVVVDRRPQAFRYTVLLPGDREYPAVEALNRSSPPIGQHVPATQRVVVPYAALAAVWPSCPL